MLLLKKNSALASFWLVVVLCGCQAGSKHASLEQEARQQSQLISQLEHKVEKAERLLARQDLEIQAMRNETEGGIVTVAAESISQAVPYEVVAGWGAVSSLNIHQLTSGLSPSESNPFVHVVLQPLDEDAELVKVAGEIRLTAALVTDSDSPTKVGSQSLSITDSRKAWTRGLVSSGIHAEIPITETVWKQVKHGKRKLLVTATIDLGAQRVYTTTLLLNDD